MSKFTVTSRRGEVVAIEGEEGLSVMELIRAGGIDELLAMCGGNCSCATCHVYVDPAHFALLPPMEESENDLLDSSNHRTATSRLSCQLQWEPALDSMRVTVAPED